MHSLTMGLEEALRLTLQRIQPLPFEEASLQEAVGRVAAMELSARIDSPAQATSRKDGYALRASDAASATPANPARLRVLGRMAAGGEEDIALEPGATVRVLTGARIPEGADTVVAEEYTSLEQGEVLIDTLDDTAKNILPQGGDVALGQPLLGAGQVVSPVMAGLLAAAGHHIIPVRARPRVGILGTGDEIVAPGRPLKRGELYASNIITLAGFCERQGMAASLSIVGDQRGAMRDAMSELLAQADALITSGGAWRGDRDLVAEVLGELGWQKVFHRIRMGPGKAVGFGLLGHKPVFLLPGGPPSNLMGFLQIALPGLMVLAGHARPGLPHLSARLGADISDGKASWTDFFFGTLEPGPELPIFQPMAKRSRLTSIAQATAVVAIPEGRDCLAQGEVLPVQLMESVHGLAL